MRKVALVTGIAGFIGTNLLPRLIERGYKVIGIDNLSCGRPERIRDNIGQDFEFVEADVRDTHSVQHAAEGVSHILHLADCKTPPHGDPLETLEVNMLGTENLLNAATKQKARFVLGSTEEVYGGNPEALLTEESVLVMGRTNVSCWSLGVAKLMAEQLCFAYLEKHGIPITILRYFEGYGPHQSLNWQGGPQSAFISAALRREPILIPGDGFQTRTFTSVRDMVSGTILAMESPYAEKEILNIASNDSLSIINLAYLIWRLVGNAVKPRLKFVPCSSVSPNYETVRHRKADISKAYHLIGYRPQTCLIEGLSETIRWQADILGIEFQRMEKEQWPIAVA